MWGYISIKREGESERGEGEVISGQPSVIRFYHKSPNVAVKIP
jgi:hypothetical protein